MSHVALKISTDQLKAQIVTPQKKIFLRLSNGLKCVKKKNEAIFRKLKFSELDSWTWLLGSNQERAVTTMH